MDHYHSHRRTSDDPVVNSMLMSSSFAATRRLHPNPIYVPSPLDGLLPLPISSITPQFAARRDDEAFDYVHGVVDRQIGAVHHPFHAKFTKACGPRISTARKTKKAQKRSEAIPEPSLDVQFDPKLFVTTVTVCSMFPHVAKKNAMAMFHVADPPNWQKASGSVFKSCESGNLVRGIWQRDDTLARRKKFLMRERVEWNWSPDAPTGGMINVLAVGRLGRDPVADQEHVQEVTRKVALAKIDQEKMRKIESGVSRPGYDRRSAPAEDEFLARVATLKRLEPQQLGKKKYELLTYTYELRECIQCKFISNWEPRGIDVDGGTYKALWCPDDGTPDVGTFYVKIDKSIHYTTDADVFPGFSMLLNALSPALINLFMRQLAFDSIIDILERRP